MADDKAMESSMPLKVLCERCSTKVSHPFDFKHEIKFDPSKLRSFFTLSDRETQEISFSLSAVDREIAWYDKEINRMKKHTSELKKKKLGAIAYKTYVRAFVSPIRKLPVEILGDIFHLYCLQHLADFEKGRSVSVPALLLTSICSLWRTVALSRSDLWATIHLHPGSMCVHDQRILLKTLSLSRQTPLDIIVHSSVGPVPWMIYDDEASRKAMKSLLDNSSRWKTAVLRIPFHIFKSLGGRKSAVPRPEFTILEKLELGFPLNPMILRSDEWWRVGSRIFESAKRLKSLTLPEYNPSMKIHLPSTFKNVRELSIQFIEDSWVDVLRSFQNLDSLHILEYGGSDSAPPDKIASSQITSSDLTHLLVSTSHDTQKHLSLFSHLRLPNLERLEVIATDDEVIWSSKAFSSMMKQARFSLHTLSLGNVSLTYKGLLDALYLTPSLTHLSVIPLPENDQDNQLNNSTFFNLLSTSSKYTVTCHSKPNLPRLTHLDFKSEDHLNGHLLASIVDMLKSRLASTSDSTLSRLTHFKFLAQHSLYLYKSQDLSAIRKFHSLSSKHPKADLDIRIFRLGANFVVNTVPLSEKAVRDIKPGVLDDSFASVFEPAAAAMQRMLGVDSDEEDDWYDEDEYEDEYGDEYGDEYDDDDEYDSEDDSEDDDDSEGDDEYDSEDEDEENRGMEQGPLDEEPTRLYGYDLD